MGVTYLSTTDVAERMGITLASVYRRNSAGDPMPPSIKTGKKIRYREDAFDKWMLDQEKAAA